MLGTRFCRRFGIDAPIVAAPMGPDLTEPELVAAVCNAGGFGVLQAQLSHAAVAAAADPLSSLAHRQALWGQLPASFPASYGHSGMR